ncbi:MAG: hypothetical protein OXH57_11125 [Ekhidna sp.]|nr:hypothetical protein [Ekhidna sp.]
MTGKGLANTVFVGVIGKIPGVERVTTAATIKDNGVYQKNAIFTEIVKSLPDGILLLPMLRQKWLLVQQTS